VKPGNPIYAVPHVPFVLALAMGSLYFIAMLMVVGKAHLKRPDRLWLLSFSDEPIKLSDSAAIGYGLTSVLYIVTAAVIHHHTGAPALTWLGIALWLHFVIVLLFWGGRHLTLLDLTAMAMTSINLTLYIGTKLYHSFIPYFNYGQSVTMYVLEATTLLVLIWAFIGPKRRARIQAVLSEPNRNRLQEHADRRRSKGT